MADLETLPPLPENWGRGLAIVAHPDDIEFGAASAIRRWTGQGKHMAYLLLTKGEAGIAGMDPDQTAIVRQEEQRRSAAVVGVEDVTFLDFPDGALSNTPELQRQIVRHIRTYRPDCLITFNHHPFWPGRRRQPNMTDHIEAGQAVMAAIRNSADSDVSPDPEVTPWDGTQYVAVCGSPQPTHAVDVSATLEYGIRSLEQHEQYLAALDPVPDIRAWLTRDAEYAGRAAGLELATSFELLNRPDFLVEP